MNSHSHPLEIDPVDTFLVRLTNNPKNKENKNVKGVTKKRRNKKFKKTFLTT